MSDFGFHRFVIKMREELLTALVSVNQNVQQLRQEMADMAGKLQDEIDALRGQVAATKGTVDSTKTLLSQLADMLTAAADDPDEVRALAASLKSDTDSLAAAVAAFPGQGGGEVPPPDPVPDPQPTDGGVNTSTDGTPATGPDGGKLPDAGGPQTKGKVVDPMTGLRSGAGTNPDGTRKG